MHHINAPIRKKNIIFYALCILYVLSGVTIVSDIVMIFIDNISTAYYVNVIQGTVFGCCDFISQSILIYRCWCVWHRNIYVVIIPSFLTFAFLVLWTAGGTAPLSIDQGQIVGIGWGTLVLEISLAVSMTVNALVTGLIVFRIFQVFQEVKPTSEMKCLGAISGRTLRSIIFILIESGMALFSIQLARLVVTVVPVSLDAAVESFNLIVGIHEMLNGITPTIILVRVSMGLSFHDENSMVEAISSLQFACAKSGLMEDGSIGSIVDQEGIGNNYIPVQDSEMGVDRENQILSIPNT